MAHHSYILIPVPEFENGNAAALLCEEEDREALSRAVFCAMDFFDQYRQCRNLPQAILRQVERDGVRLSDINGAKSLQFCVGIADTSRLSQCKGTPCVVEISDEQCWHTRPRFLEQENVRVLPDGNIRFCLRVAEKNTKIEADIAHEDLLWLVKTPEHEISMQP